MAGKTKLEMKLGPCLLTSEFIVSQLMAAACVIGAEFCDKVVIAILPQDRKVQLTNVTSVPILRDPGAAYH